MDAGTGGGRVTREQLLLHLRFCVCGAAARFVVHALGLLQCRSLPFAAMFEFDLMFEFALLW